MARFGAKPFALGSNDCAKLAKYHLREMGHRTIPSTGNYTTELGAARRIKQLGVKDLGQLLDKHLKPIAPAAMLPGDIAMMRSDPEAPANDIGTLVICLGRKVLGWHPDHEPLAVMEPLEIEKAWRA